ncbi:uncharacterized protein [Watersipora subatra]|uniref:uncharacterized protein n=1 Tax=Watersipora subatra TaxID=2589382 RepID=UPI00355BDD99
MVRRIVRCCEVCQAAKHSGNKGAAGCTGSLGPSPGSTGLPLLDGQVFCYMGLPKQIHTDQGAQFESQLMEELCLLWRVEKMRTTPYHPQANCIVKRNNWQLGDLLRAFLLTQGQEEWDRLLPKLMRACRGTPHSVTGETANLLIPPLLEERPSYQYMQETQKKLEAAHEILREAQQAVRYEDQEEPPLYAPGEWVWLRKKRRRRRENPKLQAKYMCVGPFKIIKA